MKSLNVGDDVWVIQDVTDYPVIKISVNEHCAIKAIDRENDLVTVWSSRDGLELVRLSQVLPKCLGEQLIKSAWRAMLAVLEIPESDGSPF